MQSLRERRPTSRLRASSRRGRLGALAAASALSTACIMHTSDACAEPSAWFAVGGGYGFHRSESRGEFDGAGAFTASVGVGSSPLGGVVVGGLVRSTTYFTLGTDVSLALRVASGGFARGQWGVALDVGPSWRSWSTRSDYGRFPLSAMVTGGAPWGLSLGLGTQLFSLDGEPFARGAVAVIEFDFLRFSVMRRGATDRFWENPSPAGGASEPR